MKRSITPSQIKHTNRQLIYDYIYKNGKVSQQDIAYALRLSRPTVASNLNELEADGLIYRNGQQDSDLIGRKAIAYSVVPDFRVAIGVELMRRETKIIAVDLYGKKIERTVIKSEYQNDDSYYQRTCASIVEFIESLQFRPEQLLGVGFAMQGLVSEDGSTVLYGAILKNSGLTVDAFQKYLPCPCMFIHDPEGAALTELWYSPELTNALYISLSKHLGGAMILNRNVLPGKYGHSATFEHIQINPRGALCYCGKRGCMETLCSMSALLGQDPPEPFFEAVRNGSEEEARRWKTFLLNLARMIYSLRLIYDADIVLGGHLAPFFNEEDIRFLYQEIRKSSPFEEPDDFLLMSKMPSHNITIGAALVYIRSFLNDIDIKS